MPTSVKSKLIAAPINLLWPVGLEIIKNPERYLDGVSNCEIQSVNPNLLFRKLLSYGVEINERIFVEESDTQKIITSTFLSNPAASGKSSFLWEQTGTGTNLTVNLDWEWLVSPPKPQDALDNCAERYLAIFLENF